jgi:thiol reductant ABC exporter CydD subunit
MAVGAGFFAGALFAVQAVLLSTVVNRVFLLGQTLADVLPVLGLMAGLLAVRAILIWAQEILAQRSASRVKGNMRRRLVAHVYALGPAYTRGECSGELVNTVVAGVETLDDYVTQFLPARYLAALVPVLVFLIVFLLDPWTTLVLLFAGPMLILLLALIGGRAKTLTERRFLELSWTSAFYLDVLQGLATLKMFGRSQEQAETIEEISRHYGKTTMEVLATAFQTSLMMEWAATAATAMVALEVSLRLMNGSLPFDRALAVLLLTPEFFLPLRQLAIKYHVGTAGKAAAERVFAILDTPATETQPQTAHESPHSPAAGHTTGDVALSADPPSHRVATPPPGLRFEDVSFAYRNGERPALQGLTLAIPPGQTVALVGATGAGKTTVANLLLRFAEPDAGRVLVDGAPLSSVDPATWRRRVAWVPQLPYLFHGTVADNIRLARPQAGLDAVIAAARDAHAHDFIRALPHGYDTPLGGQGARLSGGQRQRLAIARAFLKDAAVLLLDEATANLDATSDALIRDALARLMAGRTVLIIAHRLELAYTADQIVVMQAGRAAEMGTHRDLLARSGLYRQLVTTYEATSLHDLHTSPRIT